MSRTWALWATLAFHLLCVVKGDAPVLEVSGGKIKGEDKESRDDRDFYAYRGIPYAQAKRFEVTVLI
jgi:hypothetical protein